MARIRTIKPDAFLSESLSTVPRGTRWTFAGLWTCADDAGRGRDDARLIKAALYPLDDAVELDAVTYDLALLATIGGICRYVVEDRSYFHMPNWLSHQRINRPTPSKLPECPVHEGGTSGYVIPSDDSLTNHGAVTEPSLPEGKGREGNREGEGEVEAAAPTPPSTALALVSEDRADAERVCEHFAQQREAMGSKRPVVTPKWLTEARLLLDRDGRTEEQVHACIRWLFTSAHRDAMFWRTNIRSLPKLRAEYDRLRELAERPTTGTKQQETDALFERNARRMGIVQ